MKQILWSLALATLLHNSSVTSTHLCKAYSIVSLSETLNQLHQLLEPLVDAVSNQITDVETFAEGRIVNNKVYKLINVQDKFATSKLVCEIEKMTFIKPKGDFASVLKKIEAGVRDPPNFKFDDKKIWVNLQYDKRTDSYYFDGEPFPLYWGDNVENLSVKPTSFDENKCYRIVVPNNYDDNTIFVIEDVACRNGQALTLCEAAIPDNYEKYTSLRKVYSAELTTIKDNFPNGKELIQELNQADWCDQYQESNVDELFLDHPLQEVKNLLESTPPNMELIFDLLPNLVNDYVTADNIIQRLDNSAKSMDGNQICICDEEEKQISAEINPPTTVINGSIPTKTKRPKVIKTLPADKPSINITEIFDKAKEKLPEWITKHTNPKVLDIIFSIIGGISGIVTLITSLFLVIRSCRKDGFMCHKRKRFVAFKVPANKASPKTANRNETEMATFLPSKKDSSSEGENDKSDVYFVTQDSKSKKQMDNTKPSRPPRRSPRAKRSVKVIDVAHVHSIDPRRHSNYSCYTSEDEIQAASKIHPYYD